MDLWDKYRVCDKQTIVIIGVLVLSAKLAKADGQFSILEEEEILKIVPHEPRQRKLLLSILEEGGNDKNSIEYHASKLKKLLGHDHPEFYEFIIAVLYRLAHSDHVYSEEEDNDIRIVASVFGIQKTYLEKIFDFSIKVKSHIFLNIKKINNKITKREINAKSS